MFSYSQDLDEQGQVHLGAARTRDGMQHEYEVPKVAYNA